MASPIRLTKIVATLGPATESESHIRDLIDAGCNVVRLNASHNTTAWRQAVFDRVRKVSAETQRHVAVLLDLCGPKIRVEALSVEPLLLPEGEKVTLTDDGLHPEKRSFTTTWPGMLDDCKPGDRILLDDGAMALVVRRRDAEGLHCTITTGGTLELRKGVNLPDTTLSTPALTDKDLDDLAWGMEAGVDYVGLSFVRHPDDLKELQRRLTEGGCAAGIVAKIEKPEAVACIEEILAETDAVMVARGDLGVEMNVEEVPLVQKRITRLAIAAGRPVIVATQMLQSMIASPTPTRAEVSDVANSILDGTDAVMLSGETAVGRYAAESVAMMDRVANLTEDHARELADPAEGGRTTSIEHALANGAVVTARDIGAAAIVVLTHSGATALEVSCHRSDVPIVAISNRDDTCRRMALWRGVLAIHHPGLIGADDLTDRVSHLLAERKWVEPGATVVIISGQLPGKAGTSDSLRICRIEG
jgi:pyruvate kinase